MDDRCEKCRFLYYDKKNSLESQYIGEGNYVWFCKKYNTDLSVYLDGDKGSGVFRCNKCKEDECR